MVARRPRLALIVRTVALSTATARCTSPTATIIVSGAWRREEGIVLRPLWVDLALTLIPVACAVAAWFAGRYVARMPWRSAYSLLCVIVILVLLPLLRLVPWYRDFVDLMLHSIGGTTRFECGLALFLLGFAWSSPRKSLSPAFLGIVAGLIGFIFLTESAGRLWWRFAAPAMWANSPDANGCLVQTTGVTCSSAATAMLLHHHGIKTSEGELAYLSNTSLLGTSQYDMADGLWDPMEKKELRPTVQRMPYDEIVDRHLAFVAAVNLPDLGGHAVFIRRALPDSVEVVDPRTGAPQTMSRGEFERIWDGTALMLVPKGMLGIGEPLGIRD